MKIPRRIKFIWGASTVIRGQWFLGLIGLYDRREGMREDGIVVSVRGLLWWSGVMAGLGWVALATAGFWIWQRNPYSLLTYTDALLYPLRQAEITEKKGQAFIAQGLDLARAGRWYDAANLLRLGLARHPRDFRARLTLARFYQLTNQSALGMRVLTEGLGDDYPGRSYLDSLFKLATQGEDFETVVKLTARYLPVVEREGLPAEQRWLVEKRYGALTAAERHAEALAWAEQEVAGDIRDERRVLSLLALGRPDDARAVLAEWRGRKGADLTIVLRLEVRTMREAGRHDEMERAIEELRSRAPAEPTPHVYGIVQRAMAGREQDAAAALATYVFRFGGFAENLLLLAAPLAEIGNLPLLQQCAAAARERGFPMARFQVFLIDTHLGRGEWNEAGRILEAMPNATGKDAIDKTWREWLQLLIDAAKNSGEAPQRALLEFLRGRPWTMGLYRRTAGTMLRAERLETTRDVLELALRAYPASRWVQANAAEVKQRLLHQTAAQAVDPVGAATPTAAETAFVQRLEYLLRTKNWAEAARHIGQALDLVPVPDWLEGREAMVRLAQVRIAQGRRDLPGLGAAARLFLNGAVARSQDLLALAGEFFTAGDKAGAIALAREIVRSTPGFAEAQRSLREWEPAATEAAPTKVKAPVVRPKSPTVAQPGKLLDQLRARHAAGDVPGVLNTVRQLLNGERSRAEQVLAVAREWALAGDRESAELLIKEVLRRHEGFPPARRLQNELNTAGAGKK